MASTSSIGKSATRRVVNSELLQRRMKSAADKGDHVYITGEDLGSYRVLPGAVAYVQKKHPMGQGMSRFVYFPDYRLAGTVQEIVSILQKTGQNQINVGGLNRLTGGRFGSPMGTAPLSPEIIFANSFDPLNADHAAFIISLKKIRGAGSASKKAAQPIAAWVEIATILSKMSGSEKVKSSKAAKKASPKSVQSNLAQRVADFNAAMDAVLEGRATQLLKVTDFNSESNTKVTKVDAPADPARSHSKRPEITVNGRVVQVPIVVKLPEGRDNFERYVRAVVAQSKYAQFAQAILDAVNQQKQIAPVAVPMSFMPLAAPMQAGSLSPRSQAGLASPAPAVMFAQQPALPSLGQSMSLAPIQMGTARSPIGGFRAM